MKRGSVGNVTAQLRTWISLGVASVGTFVATASVVGASWPYPSSPAASTPSSTPTTFTASERVKIPDPDWLAADEQNVYVKLDSSHLLRLDPATGTTLGDTDIGGELCQGVGASFGSVWSCRGVDDGDIVVRIDPATDQVVTTIDVFKSRQQGNLAAGFGRVWVITADGTELVGIDPDTNRPDEPIPLGVVGADLAVGTDGIWVVSSRDNAVVRVDPESRRVTGRIAELTDLVAIVASADLDGVWAASADMLHRIDPETLTVTATVPVGPGSRGGVAANDGSVWIRGENQFLTRVDTATARAVELFAEPTTSAGSVLVAFGAVWATAYDDGLLIRHSLTGPR